MTRWDLRITDETDQALRLFLAERGGKEDLSSFVEEAVRRRILELTARKLKQRNASKDQVEIIETIDEAIKAVRASRS